MLREVGIGPKPTQPPGFTSRTASELERSIETAPFRCHSLGPHLRGWWRPGSPFSRVPKTENTVLILAYGFSSGYSEPMFTKTLLFRWWPG